MWWSLITLTTVGYGDLYPISHPGRWVAVSTCLLGTCILALLVAAVFECIQFDNSEKRMQSMVYKSRLRRELKHASSRLITCIMRSE